MKALVSIAMLIISVRPLLAEEHPSALPSILPAVSYEVWGYCWDGRQYVQEPKYTLNTSDLSKASNYVAHINSFAGWAARSNIPDACLDWRSRGLATGHQPLPTPTPPTFTIWAFHSIDGNWVKDDKYCWTTTDPVKGAEYALKVNAVVGWRATDNCPPAVSLPSQFVVLGRSIPGGRVSIDLSALVRNAQNRSVRGTATHGNADNALNSSWNTPAETAPAYDNTNDIQNMINTQNMLNTQNMVNNIQDMVNTQNTIDTQNMINAMQSNP